MCILGYATYVWLRRHGTEKGLKSQPGLPGKSHDFPGTQAEFESAYSGLNATDKVQHYEIGECEYYSDAQEEEAITEEFEFHECRELGRRTYRR